MFPHFTDIALNLGTLRIVQLEQYVPALCGHSLKSRHQKKSITTEVNLLHFMDIALNLGTMYMTGVVCFLDLTDIALNFGTLGIVLLEQ